MSQWRPRRKKPNTTLRFTVLQNNYMRCNARDLKLPEWEKRFQQWFDTTVNLRKLSDVELTQLCAILKQAGRHGLLKSRADVTRRALRRKLRAAEAFASQSAIDRLGKLAGG